MKTRFTYKQMSEYLGLGECTLRTLMANDKYDLVIRCYHGKRFLLTKKNYKLLRESLEWRLSTCRNHDKLKYASAIKKLETLIWV